MSENILNVKIKQRCDTESNWNSSNPVLLEGEMAISSDKNGQYKIGDGVSKWSVLPYSKADPTSHTHNYAGSSSAGGVATSSNKLATARTITASGDMTGSVSFDGSKDVSYNLHAYYAKISVGNTNNYPYHRFAKLDTITASYTDRSSLFLITQDYSGGGFGIVIVTLRTNSGTTVSTVSIEWLVRKGLSTDSVQAGIYNVFGETYCDVFFKTGGTYAGTVVRNLASGSRGSLTRTWVLINSTEVNNTTTTDSLSSLESYATIEEAATLIHNQAYSITVSGIDSGIVNYANTAGSAKNPNALTISLNGTSQGSYDGSTAKNINITPAGIGAATSSHGTHVSFSANTPKAPGTAATGTASTVSRSDHVHPIQTSVTGNSGTANKWATACNINGMSVQGDSNRVNYGTCSTAAATGAKVVACTGFDLITGSEITVKFTVTNTASSPTLNVNNTGNKPIYYRGSAIAPSYLAANRTYTFRYNGTQYDLVGDIDTKILITNNLTSTSAVTALSANQGKILKDMIDEEVITQTDIDDIFT